MTTVQHQNPRSDEASAVYAWIITHDHTDPNPASNAEGISGPVNAPAVLLEALDTPGRGHRFRLYDDDGTLYYSGIAACNAEDGGGIRVRLRRSHRGPVGRTPGVGLRVIRTSKGHIQ